MALINLLVAMVTIRYMVALALTKLMASVGMMSFMAAPTQTHLRTVAMAMITLMVVLVAIFSMATTVMIM